MGWDVFLSFDALVRRFPETVDFDPAVLFPELGPICIPHFQPAHLSTGIGPAEASGQCAGPDAPKGGGRARRFPAPGLPPADSQGGRDRSRGVEREGHAPVPPTGEVC